MEVIIRLYEERDFDAVRDGICDLQEFERAYAPLTRRPGKDIADSYLVDLLQKLKEKQGALFVAENAGRVIGFVACYIEREDSITKTDISNVHGYISDAWVEESSREKGIFRTLNEEVEKYFKQFPEVQLIRLYVLADNHTARNAYEKTGYQQEELLLMKRLS